MTLTKSDLRSAVNNFKEENEKLNRRQKLYAGQRSDLYQLVVDDINAKKGKVSRRRYNRDSIKSLPTYSAPLNFDSRASGLPHLWECKMYKLTSSFITAVGYNASNRVLKLILNDVYVYTYHDVPESAFRAFLSTNSPGKFYNRFKNTYAGFRLV